MGELGLLGVPWPEELGGAGLDLISYMIVIHELAKVDASHGLTDLRAHHARHVADRAASAPRSRSSATCRCSPSGKVMGGFGLTEPEAGSDAGGTRTTAVRTRRLLRPQRHEAVHHARQRRRDLRRHRGDRSVARARRASARSSSRSRRTISRRRRSVGVGHEPSLPAMQGFRAGKKEDKLGWRASDTCRADHGGRRGAGRESARRGGARASSTS